ncbi:DUF1648 domain-containing protein [Paenibacillus pini]|uniref:DUF1648 domain-containing protein n=1 Tax=Paenibacillus pini JCM 16418 TaxID=1236976 RepID=W7YMG1_9BACL|nr:DUF5808 domain-containing protein [Paenibacillus pini]GAF09627.1 hypothetical protein JCM16418_3777 [Paenibacillus pini JCM 16418]
MNWISTIVFIAMLVPISLSLICMPYLTRRTVSFGISVSEEVYSSPELRRMRKQYAWISAAIYGLLILLSLLTLINFTDDQKAIGFGAYIIAIVVSSTLINVMFYYKMKRLKATLPKSISQGSIIAVDTRFRNNNHKLIYSNKWFLIHLALVIGSVIITLVYYDRIPSTIPMKFDFDGHVTRSADKSYRTILGFNLMQLAMIGLFMFINWTIKKSKQQISPTNSQQSVQQNIIFRRRWSLFVLISGLMMVLMFTLIQFNIIFPIDASLLIPLSLITPITVVIIALILSFTTGQGGSRIHKQPQDSSSEAPVNDDSYWKFGGIYYNPLDPSLFVEKRMGIGWTINTARPLAWTIFAVIIGGILAISLITS